MRQQIANRLDRWSAFSLEFLKHLIDDWDRVGKSFFATDPGMLVGIQSGCGDTHDNDRSVLIASFASGARIVYKPRSLAVGQHLQQLLAWLNDRGVEPGFRVLKILDRGDHLWAEFVADAPCLTDEEVSRFYRRQGGLSKPDRRR
jgi:lantibiotic modifying enzyme